MVRSAARRSETRTENLVRIAAASALMVVVAVVAAPGVARAERSPDALFGALERAVASTPLRGDLAAIVAQAGHQPILLEDWVQKNVRWEPYVGILRGARGTAAARAGNAIDQALLLQALIEQGGGTATIKTRPLSAAEGKQLMAGFMAVDAGAALADAPRLGAAAAVELSDPEATAAAEATAAINALRKIDGAAVDEAVQAAKNAAPKLIAALDSQKALRPRRIAAPRDHYWIEVGDDVFDPLRVAKKGEQGKVVGDRQLAQLGHTLVLSLVMKRTRDGEAEEETLLQVPVALDEAAWAPIELTIRPAPKKLRVNIAEGRKDPRGLAERLAKAPVLRASLLIGQVRHGAAGFDRAGVRYDIGSDGEVGGPAQLGDEAGEVLGDPDDGGAPAPKADAKLALVAVVLRAEVRGPGEANNPERVHERVLVTPAADELPVVRVSLLAETLVLAPGERELSTLRALLATKPAFDALMAGSRDIAGLIPAPSEPAPTLMRYADLRRQVQARLAAESAARPLRERTGLVALVDRLVLTPQGELVAQRRFDIFANPLAYMKESGDLNAKAAVLQGVADTALEAALLGPESAEERAGTAWALLEGASGTPKTTKSGGLVKVGWSDAAWWSVDPRSGAAVGRVPGGGGQAMVEYAKRASETACNWGWVLSIFASSQPENPYDVGDANTWVSSVCSVLNGTGMQQAESEHFAKITDALWKIAVPALAGLPARR